jgi:hypothetical protein
MSPRDLVYVGHMLDMAKKAVSKTHSLSRDAYDADENLRLALIPNLRPMQPLIAGVTGRLGKSPHFRANLRLNQAGLRLNTRCPGSVRTRAVSIANIPRLCR